MLTSGQERSVAVGAMTPEPLVHSPQRFGILPTLRFWRSKTLPARLRASIAILTGLPWFITGMHLMFGGYELGEFVRLAVVASVCGAEMISLGLVERMVRRAIARRREVYAALEAAQNEAEERHTTRHLAGT